MQQHRNLSSTARTVTDDGLCSQARGNFSRASSQGSQGSHGLTGHTTTLEIQGDTHLLARDTSGPSNLPIITSLITGRSACPSNNPYLFTLTQPLLSSRNPTLTIKPTHIYPYHPVTYSVIIECFPRTPSHSSSSFSPTQRPLSNPSLGAGVILRLLPHRATSSVQLLC